MWVLWEGEREGEKKRKDRGVREREKRRKWAGGERKGEGGRRERRGGERKDEAPTSKSVVMRTREEPDRNSLIIRSRSF